MTYEPGVQFAQAKDQYELVATRIASISEVIGELLRLDHLAWTPEDVDTI